MRHFLVHYHYPLVVFFVHLGEKQVDTRQNRDRIFDFKSLLKLIAKTPVKPYVGLEKFLPFIFPSVCDATAAAEIIRFA